MTINKSRLDSKESVFFERELESIKTKEYNRKFPTLQFANGSLIPIDSSHPEYAREITYPSYDSLGIAKIISDYSMDLPNSDVKAKETTVPVRDIGSSFQYSIREIQASNVLGKGLETRKSQAATRSINQTFDDIILNGNKKHGIIGFLTHPNVPEVVIPADGAGSSKKFVDKTPDQILRDMNSMARSVSELTNGVESPDTMLMDLGNYEYISETARSSVSDTTIKEFFLRNSSHIREIIPVVKLKGADSGENVLMVYRRDADNLTVEIPSPIKHMSPQEVNMVFKVNVMMSTGGVIIYYPLSVAKASGV